MFIAFMGPPPAPRPPGGPGDFFVDGHTQLAFLAVLATLLVLCLNSEPLLNLTAIGLMMVALISLAVHRRLTGDKRRPSPRLAAKKTC